MILATHYHFIRLRLINDTREPKGENNTLRQHNRKEIAKNAECQTIISEMRNVEKFISEFGFLSLGRDFIMCKNRAFSIQMVSTACELTLGNVISCCEAGCIADAYSLLRKYRDDLFFYLYIEVFHTSNMLGDEVDYLDEMEKNIDLWTKGKLSNLHESKVLTRIGKIPRLKEAVDRYQLKGFLDEIGNRLNDYVHSNGIQLYNRAVTGYIISEIQRELRGVLTDMRRITITMLFLLTLCSPLSIMSTDYTDYLDNGETPPEGSQCWVAPFVSDFFRDNLVLIDKNCFEYLKDNTSMIFD